VTAGVAASGGDATPARSRARKWALAVGGTLLAGGAAIGYWHHRTEAAARYAAPVFVEAPAGPRAPGSELLGVRVGVSVAREVRARMSSWGVVCADRSVRTMMAELRDRKRQELRLAKARGQADAVTGASILAHRTAQDDNPQLRLSCDDTPSSRLADRARPPSTGRALFVFDTDALPARHASYERSHTSWGDAVGDFTDTRAAFKARFGEPGAERAAPALPGEPLPRYERRFAEWHYADLSVRVSVSNLGGRGFSVSEVVEVPWPIRADAPAR
jgi:hypothetical protein